MKDHARLGYESQAIIRGIDMPGVDKYVFGNPSVRDERTVRLPKSNIWMDLSSSHYEHAGNMHNPACEWCLAWLRFRKNQEQFLGSTQTALSSQEKDTMLETMNK